MPFPFAPVISGLTSAFNLFEQNRYNTEAAQIARENTDKTIAAQKDAADLAWRRNLEQWNRANLYDSPAQQMARLKGAGLNPMLVYGTGNPAGGSNASPQMQTISPQYEYQAQGANRLDGSFATSIQDMQLKQAQIDNVKASTRAQNQKTALDTLEQFMKALDNLYAGENKDLDLKIKGETLNEIKQRVSNNFIRNFLENQDKTWDIIGKSRADYQSNTMFPYQMESLKGSVEKQRNEIRSILAGISQTEATTQNVKAKTQTESTYRDKLKQDLQNEQVRKVLLDTELMTRKWEQYVSISQGKYTGVTNPLEALTRFMATGTLESEDRKMWDGFMEYIKKTTN